MKGKNWVLALTVGATALVSLAASAELILEKKAGAYVSGRELAIRNVSVVEAENGHWIDVPVDYGDPKKGMTSLYFWFVDKFEPSRPTMVVFAGGPGMPTHMSNDNPASRWFNALAKIGYNILLFDQRGVAFSKPDSSRIYNAPLFYSCINTAKDVERIRIFLGISQLSVYGKSYGTIPATVYASMFEKSTRSLTLEGTVGLSLNLEADESHFIPAETQRFYDSLPIDTQVRLTMLSERNQGRDSSFPEAVKAAMMMDGQSGLKQLHQRLEASSDLDSVEKALQQTSEKLMSYIFSANELYGLNRVVNRMLGIRELGLMTNTGQEYWVLTPSGQIRIFRNENVSDARFAKAASEFHPIVYRSSDFKTTVPTYYIQGDEDGAANPWGAVQHWMLANNPHSEMLMLRGGGHFVSASLCDHSESSQQCQPYLHLLFKNMLDGAPIQREQVESVNALGPDHFVLHTNLADAPGLTAQFSPPFRVEMAQSAVMP
jgi:proline iminopeptidase